MPWRRNWVILLIAFVICGAAHAVQQWDVFELTLHGPEGGNPFDDIKLSAQFTSGDKSFHARGFYDGGGTYRVRFMPPMAGAWKYQTHSDHPELDAKSGEFTCDPPGAENHGPVRVRNTFHFAYADGSPYKPIGTTSYGWVFQPDAMEDQTIATLKASAFNKIRMAVLPIPYGASKEPIELYPFVRNDDGKFDFSRFDPRFFQHLEQRVGQLRDLNIEADLILFTPYNEGLGFHQMSRQDDERFVKYTVARLSAYRNVWWSLANEYDLIKTRVPADWDRIGKLIQSEDPSDHLRSIHFSRNMLDPAENWITHMSVQNGNAVADFGRAGLYRDVCPKPVVYDEVCYEGNLDRRWGQLSGEEMTRRFWLGTIAGTYVGHGEVWADVPESKAWTARGGELRGTSPARIAFLRKIIDDAPPEGIEPIDRFFESNICGKYGEYYLIYFGNEQPKEWTPRLYKEALSDGLKFQLDIIDTWNMTITPTKVVTLKRLDPYMFGDEDGSRIDLPGKPYMAIRLRRVH